MFHLIVRTPDDDEVHITTEGDIRLVTSPFASVDAAGNVVVEPEREPGWYVTVRPEEFALFAIGSMIIRYIMAHADDYPNAIHDWQEELTKIIDARIEAATA